MAESSLGILERHVLPILRDPSHVDSMSLADWDDTLRLLRQARLMGLVGHRIGATPGRTERLPVPVQGHFRSAINYSAFRVHAVQLELRELLEVLPANIRVTLLKGAAYIAQELPFAAGRVPNDVDLLVARADLDAVEAALVGGGWESDKVDPYDQRYYREWSHELPPMRAPGHALEVDLHHTIAPVTSRTRANDEALFAALLPVPNSRFWVLGGEDQVIHAAIHLFQDSDLSGRLRDLVDIDALLRGHVVPASSWPRLIERARTHGASRILWYALHYCRSWLATPVPEDVLGERPPPAARRAMDWVFSRSCPPRIEDGGRPLDLRLAQLAGEFRYHRLRMPAGLLARHVLHKITAPILPSRSG